MTSSAPTVTASDSLQPRHPVPADTFTFEPSERHVRAVIDATNLVDSYSPVLVWEPGRPVPTYVFPRSEVRTDLLHPSTAVPESRHQRVKRWYDAVIDRRRYPALLYEYDIKGLENYLGVEWFGRVGPGIQHWYEEDEEIFQHPRDPYKRVDALVSSRHVEIFVDGVRLADTHRPVLLFETKLPIRYYIPPQDVDFTHLTETRSTTTCPYKGNARYWSVEVGGRVHPDLVWSYPTPIAAVAAIKDYLAFYNELVETVVDGVSIPRPQTPFRPPQSAAR